MSDATPTFDDGSWVQCPAKIVFMEHDRLDRAGKLLERVDRDRLEKIADQLNERDRRGQLCPITPGHTDDSAPEHEQPPHWGYARRFEVVWDDQKRKHVLRACWYIRREHYEAARSFPNVSPEYWHQDGILDPISLLRRTPKLDLGQWTYAKAGRVVRYSLENQMSETSEKKGEHKASADPAEKGVPKAQHEAPAEHEQPNEGMGGPAGIDPHFHEQFSKCMADHYASGEHHRYMLQFPQAPAQHAMGMPGPTNGAMPGGTVVPPGGEHVSRMQKNQSDIEVSRYERENQDLRGRLALLEKSERVSRYERDLTALLGQGYRFELAEEVKDCEDMTAEQFAKHTARIKTRYGRIAGHAGDDMVSTRGGTYATAPGKEEEKPLSQDDMNAYYRYQREQRATTGKDPSHEDCLSYAKKYRRGEAA